MFMLGGGLVMINQGMQMRYGDQNLFIQVALWLTGSDLLYFPFLCITTAKQITYFKYFKNLTWYSNEYPLPIYPQKLPKVHWMILD